VNFGYRCYLSRFSQKEWFASFEKQDVGLLTFDKGHTYQIEGISTVRIKLFDGMIGELKDVKYIP